MRKKCAACERTLSHSSFYPDRRRPDKLYSSCKYCTRSVARKHYAKNKKKLIAATRKWRSKNREHLQQYSKKYRKKFFKQRKLVIERWRSKNSEYVKRYAKKYYEEHKPQRNRYVRRKSRADVQYRLQRQLRVRLADAVRLQKGIRSTSAIGGLGCSLQDFRTYIESLWKSGMTWKNWGRGTGTWQIDHVKPLSKFDLTDPMHVAKACFFKNLQPLWHEEHAQKTASEIAMAKKKLRLKKNVTASYQPRN